jgi:hypothetical protein
VRRRGRFLEERRVVVRVDLPFLELPLGVVVSALVALLAGPRLQPVEVQ